MENLVKFLNGWTAFGGMIFAADELYKMYQIPTSSFAGALALLILVIALFVLTVHNFSSVA